MHDLLNSSLFEICSQLRTQSISAAELLALQQSHNAAYDARINAFIAAVPLPGDGHAPLFGAPLANKDIFHFSGRAATGGSLCLPDQFEQSATVIELQRRAGASLLGWLNLDEFAAGGTGENVHYGRCANPWNPAHITGGSSGGSAAAVAARMCYAALGSDAGGSIRIPAALCGVTGLKPTYGLVSRRGALARTWSMDCIGPLAREARDAALLLDVIAAYDPLDATSVSGDRPATYLPENRGIPDVRIGLVTQGVAAEADTQLLAAMEEAARCLASSGAQVVATGLDECVRINRLQQVVVKCEGAAMLGPLVRDPQSGVSLQARSVLQEGFLIPATRYIEALSLRGSELDRFVATYLQDHDVLMTPVVPQSAPRFADVDSDNAADIDRYFSASAVFTRFANYLGIPALSVPCGFDGAGMPLAFQLIGRPFSEKLLLQIAHSYQLATDHHRQIPAMLAAA